MSILSPKSTLRLQAIIFFAKLKNIGNFYVFVPAILIGVIAGLGSWLVHAMLELFGKGFDQAHYALTEYLFLPGWLAFILIPGIGGLLSGLLIYFFAHEAKGHGVPELMIAVLKDGGKIRPIVGLIKAITAALTIASGGSAGNEGPIAQIGGSIGSAIAQFFRVSTHYMRTYVACGVAGGIAAAFNAPIAGVMFSVEIILGEISFAQLTPIVISAVMATVISRATGSDTAFFDLNVSHDISSPELLNFALLGVISALIAIFYTKFLYKSEDLVEKAKRIPPYVKPMLGGFALGAVGLFYPEIMGIGLEVMQSFVVDDHTVGFLLTLLIMKIVATSLTLASGGSGGVFSPSLFIGLIGGKLVGIFNNWAFARGVDNSGAFAIVGMAAVVGATTHAPLTAFMIVFELSNDYDLILPLMISTVIGVTIASKLMPESIYSLKLIRVGINIREGFEQNILKKISVRQALRPFKSIPASMPLADVISTMESSRYSAVSVVDEQQNYLGVISASDMKAYLSSMQASEDVSLMQGELIALDALKNDRVHLIEENDNLHQALSKLNTEKLSELFLLSEAGGSGAHQRQVRGIVHKASIMDAYYHGLTTAGAEGEILKSVQHIKPGEVYAVAGSYSIMEEQVDAVLAGATLLDLGLRAKGIYVLLIKRGNDVSQPDPREALQLEDSLVFMGEHKRLEEIRETGWSAITREGTHG